MKRSLFVLVLAASGCSFGGANANKASVVDSGLSSDANACSSVLIFDPAFPVAGDHIKVTAQVYGSGVVDYAWLVDGVPNTTTRRPTRLTTTRRSASMHRRRRRTRSASRSPARRL